MGRPGAPPVTRCSEGLPARAPEAAHPTRASPRGGGERPSAISILVAAITVGYTVSRAKARRAMTFGVGTIVVSDEHDRRGIGVKQGNRDQSARHGSARFC